VIISTLHGVERLRGLRRGPDAATDPAIGIQWPIEHHLALSGRDAEAPTLSEIEPSGVLPTWQDTRAFVEALRGR